MGRQALASEKRNNLLHWLLLFPFEVEEDLLRSCCFSLGWSGSSRATASNCIVVANCTALNSLCEYDRSSQPFLLTIISDRLVELRRKAVGLIKEFVHVSTLHKLHILVSQQVNQDLDVVSYFVLILVLHQRQDHIDADLILRPRAEGRDLL